MISRRNLIFAVVVALVVFGTVRVVHGSGQTGAKKTTHHHSCVKKHGKTGKTKAAKYAKCLAKLKSHRVRSHALAKRKHHHISALRRYALELGPALDKARNTFNSDASGIQYGSFDSLAQKCGMYGTDLQIIEYEVDGVPHPGNFYTSVAGLHYRIMGIVHDMVGAMTGCQTAAANDDSEGLGSAEADAQTAAGEMAQMDAHVHVLDSTA